MSGAQQQAILDAFEYIIKLNQDGAPAQEAKKRLAFLRQRHPDVKLDLVWEMVAYDQSSHYDVLLGFNGGTLSLGFCPDRALPWPMRGMRRWSETDLARVNNHMLKVEDATVCLDFIWGESRIIDRLVNTCLIQEALDEEPVDLSDEELQQAMDGFRRARRLYRTEDTYRWMRQHGITCESLERRVADEARLIKLRDRVANGQVEAYFEAHRSAFDSARVAQFEVDSEQEASRILEQIRLGKLDFFEAAQRYFLSGLGNSSASVFAVVRRGENPSALEKAIFAAKPGELAGPAPLDGRVSIIRVLALEPARLDQQSIEAIKKILFEDWLEERRRKADVEWFWGNAAVTNPEVNPISETAPGLI